MIHHTTISAFKRWILLLYCARVLWLFCIVACVFSKKRCEYMKKRRCRHHKMLHVRSNCWGEMRAMEIIKLNAKEPLFSALYLYCPSSDWRTGNYFLYYSDTHHTKELSRLNAVPQFSAHLFNFALIFNINSPYEAVPAPEWLKPKFFLISFVHHGVFTSSVFPRGHWLIRHSVHPSVLIVVHDMLTKSYPRYKHVRSSSWFPVWRCHFFCCALGEG